MSTHDVPGHDPKNADVLAMGCWAEHDDGSLIFVESFENARVIFSMFDMSQTPIVEYRHAMPETIFKKTFSFGGDSGEVWTWHDKTPFPWDRVIKEGAQDGVRFASAGDLMTAAQRVASSLNVKGHEIARDLRHKMPDVRARAGTIMDKISRAIAELGK